MYHISWIFLLFLFITVPTPTHAARLALIIGNSDYQKVASLDNPVNNARDMAAELKKLGFAVTLETNASKRTMKNAVRQFGQQLNNGDVGLFYYSGHGMQFNRCNYLVPPEADIQTRADIEFVEFEEQIQPAPLSPTPTPPRITSRMKNNTFAPGKVFRDRLTDGSLGPEMVWIPAGRFRMGDIQGGGYSSEKPVHWVNIQQFAMGKYEVTVGEFRQFANATGYKTDAERVGGCHILDGYYWKKMKNANWRNPNFSQNDNHPVVCVSWNDATAYIKWLSQQTGKIYRLPSEAEWEYAARSGTKTSRYWGNNPDDACRYANVADKSAKQKFSNWSHNCTDGYVYTAPVGFFQSNAFGLFDMLGNVWEWTCSEYGDKYNGEEQQCLSKNRIKVIRGGSFDNEPSTVALPFVAGGASVLSYNHWGYRVARTY